MEFENSIGLKLPVGDVPAKAAMTIKQITGLSFADIKSRAANDDYILHCDYLDEDGLKLINKLKRELKKHNIEARLFEDDRPESSTYFDNVEKTAREISDYYENRPD